MVGDAEDEGGRRGDRRRGHGEIDLWGGTERGTNDRAHLLQTEEVPLMFQNRVLGIRRTFWCRVRRSIVTVGGEEDSCIMFDRRSLQA